MSSKQISGSRLISFSEGVQRLNMSAANYYASRAPDSSHFKPGLPRTVRIGSKVSFVEHELDEYICELVRVRDEAVEVSNLIDIGPQAEAINVGAENQSGGSPVLAGNSKGRRPTNSVAAGSMAGRSAVSRRPQGRSSRGISASHGQKD